MAFGRFLFQMISAKYYFPQYVMLAYFAGINIWQYVFAQISLFIEPNNFLACVKNKTVMHVLVDKVRKHKAAVILHTQLEVRTGIPHFIQITDGPVHEVNFHDEVCIKSGSYYVLDRVS